MSDFLTISQVAWISFIFPVDYSLSDNSDFFVVA